MDQPILEALTGQEVAFALRDYVLRKAGIDPSTVRVTVRCAYKMNGSDLTAAVDVQPAPPEAKR